MTDRLLILVMFGLGLGLSTVKSVNLNPGLVKGIAWFIAGISKFLK